MPLQFSSLQKATYDIGSAVQAFAAVCSTKSHTLRTQHDAQKRDERKRRKDHAIDTAHGTKNLSVGSAAVMTGSPFFHAFPQIRKQEMGPAASRAESRKRKRPVGKLEWGN